MAYDTHSYQWDIEKSGCGVQAHALVRLGGTE